MTLAIRVTASATMLHDNDFFKYLAERSDVVCCVEHPADAGCNRTHVHIYVAGCKVKYDAIGNKLTAIGIPKGNNGRSIKATYNPGNTSVDEGYVTYMSKGKFNASFLHTMTGEEYEELKSRWVNTPEVNAVKAFNKLMYSETKSKKNKTDFEIYEEIYEYLTNFKYKCDCYQCKPYYQSGTISNTLHPNYEIQWEPLNEHNHMIKAEEIIRDTRRKYKKMTIQRTMESYLYQLINHRSINEFSHNRLMKFLFS